MKMQYLNAASFRGAVVASTLTFVKFTAAWCPPCRTLQPILEELAGEAGSEAAFYAVDVDSEPELASQYGIMGMPTVIAFQAGELVEKLIGLRPKQAYEAIIRKYASRTVS